jgi:hypothetical protein
MAKMCPSFASASKLLLPRNGKIMLNWLLLDSFFGEWNKAIVSIIGI